MPVQMNIEIKGLDDLVKRMRKEASGVLAAESQRKFMAMGALIEREAKPLAPVRTGTLRRSIHFEPMEPLGVRIGSSVFYAKFVEFGTGRRGSQSGVRPFAGYSYGSVAGMAARPYLQPGLRAAMPTIRGMLRDLGLSIVGRLKG